MYGGGLGHWADVGRGKGSAETYVRTMRSSGRPLCAYNEEFWTQRYGSESVASYVGSNELRKSLSFHMSLLAVLRPLVYISSPRVRLCLSLAFLYRLLSSYPYAHHAIYHRCHRNVLSRPLPCHRSARSGRSHSRPRNILLTRIGSNQCSNSMARRFMVRSPCPTFQPPPHKPQLTLPPAPPTLHPSTPSHPPHPIPSPAPQTHKTQNASPSGKNAPPHPRPTGPSSTPNPPPPKPPSSSTAQTSTASPLPPPTHQQATAPAPSP